MPLPIYLDHNATTPLAPEAAEAMRECYQRPFLNPASQHSFGREARRRLESAREQVGAILGAKTAAIDADQVIFTSGGTEANHLAIRGLAEAAARRNPPALDERPHLVVSSLEHPSVSALADQMGASGWRVDRLDADAQGRVRVDQLPRLIRPETRLVSVMLAQNETGVIQPIAEIAEICRQSGVAFHTDAAQAVAKIPVDFRALGAAALSASPHKFNGPVGAGILLLRHGVELAPQQFGGFQQGALRPGTESVALAVATARALELWHDDQAARAIHLHAVRDHFEALLTSSEVGVVVIGRDAPRIPNTSNLAFPGLNRQALFMALDQSGVACSTGSACASGSSEPSPVHLAMGLDDSLISSALRFSFGAATTLDEAAEAARRILFCCNSLRRQKHP